MAGLKFELRIGRSVQFGGDVPPVTAAPHYLWIVPWSRGILRLTSLGQCGRRRCAFLKEEGLMAKQLELRVGQAVFIGRGVKVTLEEITLDRAKVRVEAPRCVAVTRDDFTIAQHLEAQREREEATA